MTQLNKLYVSKIKDLLLREEYTLVREYIENLLLENPDNYYLNNYLAITYLCLGENELSNAIYLDLLLNIDESEIKNISDTIFDIADLNYNQNKFNLAIDLYYQGLELNPEYVDGYINLAQIFAQQSNTDLAVEILNNLLENNPNCLIAYQKLGLLWQNIKEWEGAIASYEQGRRIDPNNIEILSSLAHCYLKINDLDASEEILKTIIKINPDYLQSYGELGYVYLLKKQLNLVIILWQRLIKKNSKRIHKYKQFCKENKKNNQDILSLNYNLIESIDKDYSLGEISQNIAEILFHQEKYHLAIHYYQKALESGLETEIIYQNLIYSLIYSGKINEINPYLDKLDRINPNHTQTIINKLNNNRASLSKNYIINPVKKYYETAYQWAEENNLLATNYYSFNLDNIINLKPPKNINNFIHPSFYFPEKIELPKPFLIKLPNGIVYLKATEGSSAIFTKDNYLIGDLSPESPALSPNHPDSHPSKHSVLKTPILPPKQTIKGKVLVLVGLLNDVYFHWLFDILPRIYLVELAKISLEDIDYILVDNRTTFQRETLEILNIPIEKILPLSFPLHLQADELIIPSFPGCIAWMPSWSCQYLRDKLSPKKIKKKPFRKLYISRNKSNTRRLINEKEIIYFLEKEGFEIINLESLSVKKQAELLAETKIVISPHGSGLSNLVFCQPDTKVIELFAPNYVYPCYWLVSNLVNLDYHYLVGEIIGSEHFHSFLYLDNRLEDILIIRKKYPLPIFVF